MSFLSRRGFTGRRRKDQPAPRSAPDPRSPPAIPYTEGVELARDRPPLLPVSPGADPVEWAAGHRNALRAVVVEHGAVLVRGLGLRDADQAGAVFRQLTDDLMSERESFAPRRRYGAGVYASTAWPANQPMCMHHELSYRVEFPGLLLLACLKAPKEGGATGVADAEAVLAALPPTPAGRFERDGWLLTRSYNEEIGASVAETFGTDDRTVVEAYCRAHAIDFAWQPDGTLHTRQRRPAVLRHPVTGRRCWFNQIAFLSEWTMDPEVRAYLVELYGVAGLPFNTRYGDGEPIGEDVVRTLNEIYEAHTVREPWRPGDLMLIDNIRCAHSRDPFEGAREVLVGLADPVRLTGGGTDDSGTTDPGAKNAGPRDSDPKDEVSFT